MNKFYIIKTKKNATRNFDKWLKKQIEEVIELRLDEMNKQLFAHKK